MPSKLLIKPDKHTGAFLPKRKSGANLQLDLACKSRAHWIIDWHHSPLFVCVRPVQLAICCTCALIPPFSLPTVVLHCVGAVMHVDTIYRADHRPAKHVGGALESTGEKVLCNFVVWDGLGLFFFPSSWAVISDCVTCHKTSEALCEHPCTDFRARW